MIVKVISVTDALKILEIVASILGNQFMYSTKREHRMARRFIRKTQGKQDNIIKNLNRNKKTRIEEGAINGAALEKDKLKKYVEYAGLGILGGYLPMVFVELWFHVKRNQN